MRYLKDKITVFILDSKIVFTPTFLKFGLYNHSSYLQPFSMINKKLSVAWSNSGFKVLLNNNLHFTVGCNIVTNYPFWFGCYEFWKVLFRVLWNWHNQAYYMTQILLFNCSVSWDILLAALIYRWRCFHFHSRLVRSIKRIAQTFKHLINL